jgi:hypothetical protein
MSDQQTQMAAGDESATVTVAGSRGCCDTASRSTGLRAGDPLTAASPCCGTQAEARATGSCCAGSAKVEVVATGTGCCG